MRRPSPSLVEVALFAVLLAPTAAFSRDFTPQEIDLARRHPEYFAITATEVLPLPFTGGGRGESPSLTPAPDPPAIEDIGAIINIGRQVWDIIVANKPVVDVKNSFASAMPRGITRAEQLSGWQAPEGKVYELRAKNAYGMEVVRLRYLVLRAFGGTYKGKGRYLTGVTVQPLNVDVLWGYRFSVAAAAPSTTNAGTDSDPVAGMTLTLDWKIETPLKESRGTGVYYVQGDGVFKDVSGGLARRQKMGLVRFGSF